MKTSRTLIGRLAFLPARLPVAPAVVCPGPKPGASWNQRPNNWPAIDDPADADQPYDCTISTVPSCPVGDLLLPDDERLEDQGGKEAAGAGQPTRQERHRDHLRLASPPGSSPGRRLGSEDPTRKRRCRALSLPTAPAHRLVEVAAWRVTVPTTVAAAVDVGDEGDQPHRLTPDLVPRPSGKAPTDAFSEPGLHAAHANVTPEDGPAAAEPEKNSSCSGHLAGCRGKELYHRAGRGAGQAHAA